jgi:1-deoxy-D-xylulose-5-phosphate reductoisomerase
MTARRVSVLGSTGSVGVSTLALLDEAVRAGEAEVQVEVLVAGRNAARLAEQALRWRPAVTVIADENAHAELAERLAGSGLVTAAGTAAVLEAAARSADWVMAAIVGAAGLAPTLAAAGTGAVIALANKESIVCAGPAMIAAVRAAGGTLIPVDSEHSAIFQALRGENARRVARLILTASGGPFRTWTRQQMSAVTPDEAMDHPVWRMGPKISLDSATLANKGLELIEASYLFDTPECQIDVLVHPQSIIHSMVEFQDGSTLAQMGPPDMRTPIACAYAWPDRLPWAAPTLDLAALGQLSFEAPDIDRFPVLGLARESLRMGGHAPCAFNAANEVAAHAFLEKRIGFLDIAGVIADSLDKAASGILLARREGGQTVEAAMDVDASVRQIAQDILSRSAALI